MTVVNGLAAHLWSRVTRRFKGFGVASVGFGTPLELSAFAQTSKGDLTDAVATELMARIAGVVPVLSTPIVAHALVSDELTDRAALRDRVAMRLELLKSRKMPLPRRPPETIVSDALIRFGERGLVTVDGDTIRVTDAGHDVLAFYGASIAHHFQADPPVN